MTTVTVPKALHKGKLKLGTAELDCYVLEDGLRVVATRTVVKAISGEDHGRIASYLRPLPSLGQKPPPEATNPLKTKRFALGQTTRFTVDGTTFEGHGLAADQVVSIWEAYAEALASGALRTDRQKQIAAQCAVLLAGCARVGLTALIDEATGFQRARADDALQLKFAAYLTEKMRPWTLMFPEAFWVELHRICKWKGALHSRPKYYGIVVERIIYRSLDPDIAAHLRKNKPPSTWDARWHQWFSQDLGARALRQHIDRVTGIMRTAKSRRHLYELVDEAFAQGPAQVSMYLPRARA